MHEIILTFDVEDFVNRRSTYALYAIMRMLQKYELKAIFFITGHMAEKLSNFPQVLDLFSFHEIGYHSTSHGVRPNIFEYTDVKNYKKAMELSARREISYIHPLTGQTIGPGGIELLKELFKGKAIRSFRAPWMCWSPAHLEALADLGIEFDFSARLSSKPVYHKDVTFYPAPVLWDNQRLRRYHRLLYSFASSETTVVAFHPSIYVNQLPWDYFYHHRRFNPERLLEAQPRKWEETCSMLHRLELLLSRMSVLHKIGMVRVSPQLRKSRRKIIMNETQTRRLYERTISTAKQLFGYEPKFLESHYLHYFTAP